MNAPVMKKIFYLFLSLTATLNAGLGDTQKTLENQSVIAQVLNMIEGIQRLNDLETKAQNNSNKNAIDERLESYGMLIQALACLNEVMVENSELTLTESVVLDLRAAYDVFFNNMQQNIGANKDLGTWFDDFGYATIIAQNLAKNDNGRAFPSIEVSESSDDEPQKVKKDDEDKHVKRLTQPMIIKLSHDIDNTRKKIERKEESEKQEGSDDERVQKVKKVDSDNNDGKVEEVIPKVEEVDEDFVQTARILPGILKEAIDCLCKVKDNNGILELIEMVNNHNSDYNFTYENNTLTYSLLEQTNIDINSRNLFITLNHICRKMKEVMNKYCNFTLSYNCILERLCIALKCFSNMTSSWELKDIFNENEDNKESVSSIHVVLSLILERIEKDSKKDSSSLSQKTTLMDCLQKNDNDLQAVVNLIAEDVTNGQLKTNIIKNAVTFINSYIQFFRDNRDNIYLCRYEKETLTERLKLLGKGNEPTTQQIIDFLFGEKFSYATVDRDELFSDMFVAFENILGNVCLVYCGRCYLNNIKKENRDNLYYALDQMPDQYQEVINIIGKYDALTLFNKITEMVCDDKGELNKLKKDYIDKIDMKKKSDKYVCNYLDFIQPMTDEKDSDSEKKTNERIAMANRMEKLLLGIEKISIENKDYDYKDYDEIRNFFNIARPNIINALIEKIENIVSKDIFDDVVKSLNSMHPVVFDKYAKDIWDSIRSIEYYVSNEKNKEAATECLTDLFEKIETNWPKLKD